MEHEQIAAQVKKLTGKNNDAAYAALCRPMRGPTGEGERAAAPFLGKMDLMPVLTAKRKEKASEWSMSKLQRR